MTACLGGQVMYSAVQINNANHDFGQYQIDQVEVFP
jgi:hypothetical protein